MGELGHDGRSHTASKMTMLAEAAHNGRAANVAAEAFAQAHGSVQGTLGQHGESIEQLSRNIKQVEQQVKAISRVMVSNKMHTFQDALQFAVDDVKTYLINYVDEKNKALLATVEQEVGEVTNVKGGLLKKIEGVEEHLFSVLRHKMEEAAAQRQANRDAIKKITEQTEHVPALAAENSKILQQLDSKVKELRADFRAFERNHERENIEQDHASASLVAEAHKAIETVRSTVEAETRTLSKNMRKHEDAVDAKMKTIFDVVEKETGERNDQFKGFAVTVTDSVGKLKQELEAKIVSVETQTDHKVKPFAHMIQDVRHLVDEEIVHRAEADKELNRKIVKETSDRHQDEERLLGLITTCQASVTKMQKLS